MEITICQRSTINRTKFVVKLYTSYFDLWPSWVSIIHKKVTYLQSIIYGIMLGVCIIHWFIWYYTTMSIYGMVSDVISSTLSYCIKLLVYALDTDSYGTIYGIFKWCCRCYIFYIGMLCGIMWQVCCVFKSKSLSNLSICRIIVLEICRCMVVSDIYNLLVRELDLLLRYDQDKQIMYAYFNSILISSIVL